jgi:hypothetical protein
MRDWLRIFLKWDGLLPLAVAAVTAAASLVPKHFGGQAELFFFVGIGIPIAAALARSTVGAHQIRRVCHGELPIGRQVALAAAIVFLLVFEGAVAMFSWTDNEPASAWLYVAALYVGYLGCAALAFIPGRALTPEELEA